MSNNFLNTAYGTIQNRRHSKTFEQDDDSCDELLVDTAEPSEGNAKSNSRKVMSESSSDSEEYHHTSDDHLPRLNYFSGLSFVNEISVKFSKLNTSPGLSNSFTLNPTTCHSDQVDVLEHTSRILTGNKVVLESNPIDDVIPKSPGYETRGLFHVSNTPDDLCTKFRKSIGSNEKLITLDNVRDIKFKNKDFGEAKAHAIPKNKQETQASTSKDIVDAIVGKASKRLSSSNTTVGTPPKKYKTTTCSSSGIPVFNKNTSTTTKNDDKNKLTKQDSNKTSEDGLPGNSSGDLSNWHTTPKRASRLPKFCRGNASTSTPRPKLKNRRVSLPAMQRSLNEQFDRRNSISFGLPNSSQGMEASKLSRKRLASSPLTNVSKSSTSSTMDNEPSLKLRKRCLSSTEADKDEATDVKHRVRSSSDGDQNTNQTDEGIEMVESFSDESLFESPRHKR